MPNDRHNDAYRPEIAGLDSVTDSGLLELVIVDPDAVLERAADAAQLRAALSRLPTEDRMVSAPHDGEGWSDDARRADVEEHLRHCQWCPPLAQALIGLRAALHEGSYYTDIPATISGYLRRMIGEDELLP